MAPPFRVLLVDDEPDLVEIGRLFLERAGPFLVETCASGEAALDLLERDRFDAVVSDYQMPGMNGIELLALVRERYGPLPFVLFTGRGREQVAVQAINEGADFYVQKGGDPGAQFAELAHQTRIAIERRATERALEERERRFSALIQNSSDIVRIIDRNGLIAYDSDSGSRILGYRAGSVLGQSPLEFVHPDDRELVREALDEVYAGTSPGTPTGFRVRHADGRWIAVESVASNLLGIPGVDGIVTTTRPIEDRRQAEDALRLTERRFRRAEEIGGMGHWELDLGTGMVHASRGAQAVSGLAGDERPLGEAREMVVPEDRERVDRFLQEIVGHGAPREMEFAIRRPDDRTRRELHLVAEYDAERRAVFGILRDVTAQREAGEALRAGEERYRTLAEDMPAYVCTFLPDGTLTYVNPALGGMVGEVPATLLGRTVFDLISPNEREHVRAALGRLSPDRPVETHEQYDRAPDGSPRWQQWTNRAFYDADGRPVRFQAVGLDITDLREAEEALRRANRTLTLLSGITRHDIDNQLAVLRGYLSLARSEGLTPSVADLLERGSAAAERIASLIRCTSAWEEMGTHAPLWLDARKLVEEAARETGSGALLVENELPPGLRVWADPLITRVVAGLIENAHRHGGPATTVRFSIEEAEAGGLVIACDDDGSGVPANAKERIFERGYGENTGLGLFLARETLGLTGIAIAETGVPGRGARFELTISAGGWRRDA